MGEELTFLFKPLVCLKECSANEGARKDPPVSEMMNVRGVIFKGMGISIAGYPLVGKIVD